MRIFKIIIFVLSFFYSVAVIGQKQTVAVTAFENAPGISKHHVEAIQDKVKEALYSTNRFEIVDRTSYDKLKAEKELQKSEDFIDGKTVSQTSYNGAEYIVTGNVSQVNTVYKRTESSAYYDCTISFSLQIIDVATGQILASEIIRPKKAFLGDVLSKSIGGNSTKEKAFNSALTGMQKPINKFVGQNFKVTTSIVQITDSSSSKAKTLLINTGLLNGAKKKQEFSVIEIIKMKVGGKDVVRKKEIGKLKITTVEGDEISEAKVMKGGELILEKFNGGVELQCISKN